MKDKVSRAWKLSAKFENGQIMLPRFGVQDLTDTLVEFPDVTHDDEFDALDIAVMSTFGRQRKPRKKFGVI